MWTIFNFVITARPAKSIQFPPTLGLDFNFMSCNQSVVFRVLITLVRQEIKARIQLDSSAPSGVYWVYFFWLEVEWKVHNWSMGRTRDPLRNETIRLRRSSSASSLGTSTLSIHSFIQNYRTNFNFHPLWQTLHVYISFFHFASFWIFFSLTNFLNYIILLYSW